MGLEPGQLSKEEADSRGQPYKALPLHELLAATSVKVPQYMIAGWTPEQQREARTWAWNEMNGDKSPPPRFAAESAKSLAQIGYEAYGAMGGPAGAWKTFDGRDMPRWDELTGEVGKLTKARWVAAMQAVLYAHLERVGPRAILPNPVGA